MDEETQAELKKRYMAAVDSFIDKIRVDPNVIAAIVCGSLAYDVIWEKSDIDMTVIIRDQHLATNSYCIIEDGITINVWIAERSTFKREMEKNILRRMIWTLFSKNLSTPFSNPFYIRTFCDASFSI